MACLEIDCPLCGALHEDYRLVTENETAFAIINLEAIKEGHVMVLPKQHKTNLSDLTKEESKDLFDLSERLCKAVTKLTGQSAIIHINRGFHSTQPHIHVHILSCKQGLREFFEITESTPNRQKRTKEELTRFKEDLLKHL